MTVKTIRNVLVCAVVLIAPAGLTGCGSAEPATADAGTADLLATAERRDLEVQAEAPGSVEPIRVVEVKSRASGEILGLRAETGDQVEQGALLAEIDPREVRNDLAQARADLEVARVRARIATEQRDRTQELMEANVVTEQEYEAAELEAANARAALVRAETTLELARERMGDVTIRAPITGTVIERGVEIGQIISSAMSNVSGGTVLLRMADLAEVQVRTLVDETDIGRIAPGQTSNVEVEAFPERAFTGTVLKIEPQAVVEQNVTMFPVLIRLENPERLLKPGMNAEVTIQIANRPNAVTVPNAAIVGTDEAVEVGEALGIAADAVREALRARPAGAAAGGDAEALSPEEQLRQKCMELRDRLRSGGREAFQSMSDEDRATMRECRDIFTGGPGGRGGQESTRPGEPRPGMIFVATDAGIEPRRVMLGVNDWEHTEIVEGLQEGDQIVLVSVARLQQAQENLMNRIRERTSGPFRGGS